MSLFAIGLLSVAILMVGLLVAVFFHFTGKPEKETDEKELYKGGKKDPWQKLGLIDDTPNLIRAVVAGNENTGPIMYYIADQDGEKFNRREKHRKNYDRMMKYSWISEVTLQLFGKRVFGFPLIRKIRPLGIDRVVEKPTNPGEKRTLAEELSATREIRWGVYRFFVRPTHHADMDLKNNARASVNTNTNIEVEDPEPIFTIYKDNLLPTIDRLVGTFLKSKMTSKTYDQFKDDQKKFEEVELGELNTLLKPLGVKVTQLTLSDPELHSSIQASMEEELRAEQIAKGKRKLAEGERDAKITVAEGTRQESILKAEGEATGIERLAKAKSKRFSELVELYKANGVSPEASVDKANAMISAEFNAEAVAKLTGTYVAGGTGVQLAVSGGGKQ